MDMDTLALEATGGKGLNYGAVAAPMLAPGPVKRKAAKKAKKAVVFFEVEILDAKTKDKLCFLDKVRHWFHVHVFEAVWLLPSSVFAQCVCCVVSYMCIYCGVLKCLLVQKRSCCS